MQEKARANAGAGGDESATRPGMGIVLNGYTPYHVDQCLRFAREIPELKLHAVFTSSPQLWEIDPPPEINALLLGASGRGRQRDWRGARLRDLAVADRIFDRFRGAGVRAVILAGYASLLHLRLISRCHREGIPIFLRADANIRNERIRSRWHGWFKRRLLKWVLRRCDGIMVMGQLGRAYFEQYADGGESYFFVPTVPDFAAIEQIDAAAVADFQDGNGLYTERRYVLACCRLVQLKRIDTLIDAFAAIASRRPDWDLLIVGDGPMRAEWEARALPRLAGRVRWLGFLPKHEVHLAYKASEVFVLPSDREQWSVVVIEAAAAGLVTVVSDIVGAAYELVDDRVNGRTFRAGDVAQLSDALLDVTDDDNFRRYQDQVRPVFCKWRGAFDPSKGVREALQSVGVLPVAATDQAS